MSDRVGTRERMRAIEAEDVRLKEEMRRMDSRLAEAAADAAHAHALASQQFACLQSIAALVGGGFDVSSPMGVDYIGLTRHVYQSLMRPRIG